MADATIDRDGPPYRTPLRRPGVWAWMTFDFAAQPLFTVIITFVFGPYFVSQLAPDPATGQFWWSAAATVAGLFIALLCPLLGAVADRAGPRKPWIAAFGVVQVTALALLWFAAPGSPLVLVALLIVLAQISAEFSIVFNDAMIPRLIHVRSIGRVSNIAWGLGYAGGIIFLMFTLAFLAGSTETGLTLLGLQPLFGLDPALGEGARATGPLAALWYLVFVLPMFFLTPDRKPERPIGAAARDGIKDLKATFREIRSRPDLFRFLLARMFYQDGVNGLLILGGAFAAGMFGWSLTESGLFGIIINVAAIAGCLLASVLDAKLGSKGVVVMSIVCLVVATICIASTAPGFTLFGLLTFAPVAEGGLFASGAERSFVVYGMLIGLAYGPVQASSRSWLAQSVTAEEAGRYFGFYALIGRATSFLAPASVAALTAIAASLTDPVTASRIGMSAIIVFFAIGLAVLWNIRGPLRQEG
ncbi:MFS transporter [Aurantimonas aggregata]|uniref:MFS transporter n=1 Tax=Aurantimonas aggregata TaxID=2047720 RepID=A0A6L9MKU5_9HYPH|nr:MFS transporter [Aurantimonas aggregata]NDV88355.1 MFS transporter [Aurantimonas aggregata]